MTRAIALSAFAVAASAAYLLAIGRPLLAPSGTLRLWVNDPQDPEGSQHLLDWWSLSHVIHGVLFFGLLWLVARRLPVAWRFLLATLIECAWELFENSDAVIARYREGTVSRDYAGDSVVNSLADILCMAAGFALAARLPAWASAAVVLGLEALAMWAIRDGLLLNVLMLVWPVEAVRAWQAGG